MDYRLQLQKLLLKIRSLATPDDRIALWKQAINLVDTNNDEEWGFDLRLELIRDEKDTSRCIESLQAFTWILDAFEKYPGIFDEKDFLWEYKWMLASIRRNASIPMEQIELISEDFKIRLLRNGYSLRPYYSDKVHMAFFLGNIDDARKYLELRNKELRDDMSNCRACELDDDVELEFSLGNFDRALMVGNEMLTKKLTCGHMPFSCYCTCVQYFHKAGNMEKAHEYFLKAEEDLAKLTNDTSQVEDVGFMLRFLTDYDREKAWKFFEEHVHWCIDSEDYLEFMFSKSVLPLLNEQGIRTMTINPSVEWYKSDSRYDLREIYDYYSNKAKDLAVRFDLRNKNNYFSEQLKYENLIYNSYN